jgi:hypothetical protein
MRASEFITEVFQPGKTNWKWRRQSSDEAFASFIVADREYQWHAFTSEANLTKWEIQFRLMRVPTDPDGLDLFGTTGTGNSAEVLSTAVDITREFIKQYGLDKVEEITFNAKEDSRIGLYAKMINRLLPDWDLYQKYSKDRGMEYHLTDRRAYDKPENKTTEGQGLTEGTLSVDVPNEDWLQDKIDYAKSKGRNSYGVPYFGSTTAYVRGTPPQVRVMRLASLQGMKSEQLNVRKNDLKWLMDYMETNKKLPPKSSNSDEEYLPYIMVAYNGEAWVNEGNHRIMAAYRLNWQTMPIELRYFDGGERVKSGDMYPEKIGL